MGLVLGFTATVCCLRVHGATRDAAMRLVLLIVLVTHGALDPSLWVVLPCMHASGAVLGMLIRFSARCWILMMSRPWLAAYRWRRTSGHNRLPDSPVETRSGSRPWPAPSSAQRRRPPIIRHQHCADTPPILGTTQPPFCIIGTAKPPSAIISTVLLHLAIISTAQVPPPGGQVQG